jgi:hypothetical protein
MADVMQSLNDWFENVTSDKSLPLMPHSLIPYNIIIVKNY